MNRRCPEPNPKMADIIVTPWQNFAGEHAEYRKHVISLGCEAVPPHARIELTHSCGWALAMSAGPQSAARVCAEILEHLGATPPEQNHASGAVAVARENTTTEN